MVNQKKNPSAADVSGAGCMQSTRAPLLAVGAEPCGAGRSQAAGGSEEIRAWSIWVSSQGLLSKITWGLQLAMCTDLSASPRVSKASVSLK